MINELKNDSDVEYKYYAEVNDNCWIVSKIKIQKLLYGRHITAIDNKNPKIERLFLGDINSLCDTKEGALAIALELVEQKISQYYLYKNEILNELE